MPYGCDDGSYKDDSAGAKWLAYLREASYKFGRPLDAALKHAERLKEAGFTNVLERKFKWPTNNWPRDPKFKELGTGR